MRGGIDEGDRRRSNAEEMTRSSKRHDDRF